jgi:predicted amidophosphoribosyltransferase
VICPTCGYEFDPAGGPTCPRCGTSLSCSDVSCAECGACSGLFDRLQHALGERLNGERGNNDGDTQSESASES